MPSKKLIGAAALAAGLTGGAAVGALLGVPLTSGAETLTVTSPVGGPTPAGEPAPDRVGPLDTAAKALGMTADELRTELEGGKSIAQVAGERNVDVQTVIDALVAEATQDITAFVNHEGLPPHGEGHRGGPRFRGEGLDAAATALGISAADLRTALESGKTIAQVASDKGVDVQTVVDAVVAAESAEIDQAVTDGHLDADRAAQIKANLPDRVTAMVNGQGPMAGHRFHGPDDVPPPPEGD